MSLQQREARDAGESGVIALLLRVGVGLSAALIALGLLLLLVSGGREQAAPAGSLAFVTGRALAGAVRLEPTALVELGLIVLLVTPIARVLAGIIASARQRDWLYVLIGTMVLALVLYGLLSGQTEG